MVDPDGGVNVQKKRLKLGLIQEVNPTCNAEFPADGFQVGISCVPRIGYNHIWKYLIEDVEFKKQLSVEKPIVKGYNFFKSGKVLGLYSKLGLIQEVNPTCNAEFPADGFQVGISCVPRSSQCYAAQHSYVPLLSLRRDSPSKIVPDFLCLTL